MKYASFQHFYERELSKTINELEKTRINLKKKKIKTAVIVVAVAIVPFYFLATTILQSHWPFILASLLIFGSAFLFRVPRGFRRSFKDLTIKKMIHKINGEFKFDDLARVPKYQFDSSKLFANHINRYRGEDYIAGKIENTNFYMSEVLAQHKTSGKKSKTVTIFNGIFFVADFHKHFHKETFVLPDQAEKSFGFFGRKLQKWNPNRPPLVQLENTRFEKQFVVYSQDQTEARYILSSSMMENILKIQEKFEHNLRISFIGSKINIAIPLRKPWLEPKFWGTLINTKQLEDYHDTLKMVTEIIADLNLNRRIWTKE